MTLPDLADRVADDIYCRRISAERGGQGASHRQPRGARTVARGGAQGPRRSPVVVTLEETFAKVVGRHASDEERQRLYRLRDALGLRDNDAFWSIVMALGLDGRLRGHRRLRRPQDARGRRAWQRRHRTRRLLGARVPRNSRKPRPITPRPTSHSPGASTPRPSRGSPRTGRKTGCTGTGDRTGSAATAASRYSTQSSCSVTPVRRSSRCTHSKSIGTRTGGSLRPSCVKSRRSISSSSSVLASADGSSSRTGPWPTVATRSPGQGLSGVQVALTAEGTEVYGSQCP